MKQKADFYKLTPDNFRRMEDAEVYFMRFNNRSGWAMAIIHEPTGTIALHTDYGDWTYSWSKAGLGDRTVKGFLCDGHFDYFADKFERGKKDVFDLDATVAAINDAIAEVADDNPITWDDDTLSEVHAWLEEEAPGEPHEFMDSAPAALHKLSSELYEYFVYDKRPEYYWLRDGVLPALVEELKKTLPETAKQEA